ncbi:lipoate--protein ligase family protein [Staphylothermus hellenicus]|uniref:Biotin/lipoate A/B protein ligase n=1 Tax=Staphylothermus hellenicus (strain DSM 12710 / JCM 10830 / BK20S6-10-b1 / P8) TaxID=591019 RepID=D7DC61_STAHD|nr:biotin/lipoate A/B protein ligase family protein [Staphylothermus hellenicus]ADI31758.1 biotin/lipoate A/B protein ligase [Staphylothermus hellenicus DSM 12710]
MVSSWRLIIDEANVYYNMAMDEALLILREKEIIPNTIRIYVMRPSAVTIGYFQKIKDVLNLDYLDKYRIDYTRRITGGGAVYHDQDGEVTYSITTSIDSVSKNILESYKKICYGIIEALKELGVKAEYKPINDIVVMGRKISGNAQTRRRKALMQHGTLMYATNIDILGKVLRPPKEKLSSHKARTLHDRVTTLEKILGYKPRKEDVIDALIKGFEKALNIKLVRDNYWGEELELASLLIDKYRSREWIFKR